MSALWNVRLNDYEMTNLPEALAEGTARRAAMAFENDEHANEGCRRQTVKSSYVVPLSQLDVSYWV